MVYRLLVDAGLELLTILGSLTIGVNLANLIKNENYEAAWWKVVLASALVLFAALLRIRRSRPKRF